MLERKLEISRPPKSASLGSKPRAQQPNFENASFRSGPWDHPGMTHHARRRERRSANQPLRSPSAERFHCATLSAIMRVDFIAA
jgi:hypothetical protein